MTRQTDPNLLKAIALAAGRQLSAEQLRKQKISFIMGSLGDESTITRELVEKVLKEKHGEKTAA